MILKAVKKLEIATAAANGAMPTFATGDDLKKYLLSEQININIPKPTMNHVWVDGANAPRVSIGGRSEPGTIEFKLTDLTAALLSKVIPGTVASEKFSAATDRETIELGVKITGETVKGKYIEFTAPLVTSISGISGNPSYDNSGLATIDVTLVINQADDVDGDPVAPWNIESKTVS